MLLPYSVRLYLRYFALLSVRQTQYATSRLVLKNQHSSRTGQGRCPVLMFDLQNRLTHETTSAPKIKRTPVGVPVRNLAKKANLLISRHTHQP